VEEVIADHFLVRSMSLADKGGACRAAYRDPPVHGRGRRTVKRLPFPSHDSTVTRPPCAFATPCTIARPRPRSQLGVEVPSKC